MEQKYMAFGNINPFVRYVNQSQYLSGQIWGPRKVYDHQFIYTHAGRGYLDIDGEKFEAIPGRLFFYGPGDVHTFIADSTEPFFLLGIHFDFSQEYIDKPFPIGPLNIHFFNEKLLTQKVHFTDFDGFVPYIDLLSEANVGENMFYMLTEFNSGRRYYQNYLNGMMNVFLSGIARHTALVGQGKREDGGRVLKVLEYMNAHYNNNLTNEEIADYFHFHPNYLNRLLRKQVGVSIRQYIINVRIKKAVELLINTTSTVGEVARFVGYEDIHYFSRLVKKRTGFSPQQIKQKF